MEKKVIGFLLTDDHSLDDPHTVESDCPGQRGQPCHESRHTCNVYIGTHEWTRDAIAGPTRRKHPKTEEYLR